MHVRIVQWDNIKMKQENLHVKVVHLISGLTLVHQDVSQNVVE